MIPLNAHSVSKTCAVIAGVVGGWTLSGVLSALASLVAIVVGVLHVYDWIQKKKNEKKYRSG